MKIRATLQPLLALLLISVLLPNASSQTIKRDLKDYKQGVALDLKDEFVDPQWTNLQLAPARVFLWELWKSHTKGYLRQTSYSIEGNPTWCTFFVEPDSAGRWRVTLECKASKCPFISKKKCEEYLRTVGTATYDSIERIADDVYSRSSKKIPDSEFCDPVDYRLIFRSSITGYTAEL